MRRKLSAALGAVLVLGVSAPAVHAQGEADQSDGIQLVAVEAAPEGAESVDGRYLVQLKDADSEPEVEAHLVEIRDGDTDAFNVERVYGSLGAYSARISNERLAELQAREDVKSVAQDFILDVHAAQANPPWGLDRIDQRSLPVDNSYTYANNGAGVDIYILDTGIRSTHSDFAGRLGAGFNAVQNEAEADCNGHGTHVASTAAGATYGVAKGATIHAVKALGCDGRGEGQEITDGINWISSNAASGSVVNMSIGGSRSSFLNGLVAGLVTKGITVVVAAGNENTDACTKSPASEPSAITVAASTQADSRASFSNFGSCVDVFAPGTAITAAWHTGDNHTNTIQGTSMASPHVAGAAALYLAANGGASPADVANAITSEATAGVLSGIAGSPNKLLFVGFGSNEAQPDTSPQANETHVGNLAWGAKQEEPLPAVSTPAQADGTLTGPAWADFDLRLQKFDGRVWRTIARSTGPGSNEQITMPVEPGSYRWVVTAYTGFGDFTLDQTMS